MSDKEFWRVVLMLSGLLLSWYFESAGWTILFIFIMIAVEIFVYGLDNDDDIYRR